MTDTERRELYTRLERAIVDGASLADALEAIDAIAAGVPIVVALARLGVR